MSRMRKAAQSIPLQESGSITVRSFAKRAEETYFRRKSIKTSNQVWLQGVRCQHTREAERRVNHSLLSREEVDEAAARVVQQELERLPQLRMPGNRFRECPTVGGCQLRPLPSIILRETYITQRRLSGRAGNVNKQLS
jgi:hypothetical protein